MLTLCALRTIPSAALILGCRSQDVAAVAGPSHPGGGGRGSAPLGYIAACPPERVNGTHISQSSRRGGALRAGKYANVDPSKMKRDEKRKVAQLIMEEEHVKLIEQVLRKVPPDKFFKQVEARREPKVRAAVVSSAKPVDVKAGVVEAEEAVEEDTEDRDYEEPTHINKVRASSFVIHKGEVHVVLSSQHVSQARSRGHYKVKMRNLMNNKEVSNAFADGTKLSVVTPSKMSCVYQGIDERFGSFKFHSEKGDIFIPRTALFQTIKYLKKDLKVTVSRWKGQVVALFVPYQVQYTVVSVNPGNCAATLENGLVIIVPSYVKQGDCIDINTAKGEFLRRSVIG